MIMNEHSILPHSSMLYLSSLNLFPIQFVKKNPFPQTSLKSTTTKCIKNKKKNEKKNNLNKEMQNKCYKNI